MTRLELQEMAEERLADAQALLAAGRWTAAYYIAGYAVECALKACIAKKTREHEFPEKDRANKAWSHDFARLVDVADIEPQLEKQRVADHVFTKNWETADGWTEAARYESKAEARARDLIEAISDPRHGVLAWLRLYW